jgi:hypothetical protein
MAGPGPATPVQPPHLRRFLRRAGRRLRIARALRRTARLAPSVAATCLLLVLAGRLTPLHPTDPLALALALTAALLLAGVTVLDRSPPAQVARVADRGLGAQDVLSTALELGERADVLADRVRHRARALVGSRRPHQAVPISPPVGRLACAGALGALALVAGMAANPQDARRQLRAEVRADLEAAAAPLDALARTMEQPAAPGGPEGAQRAASPDHPAGERAGEGTSAEGSAPLDPALARQLRDLADEVRDASDPAEAAAQLRRAQADLAASRSPEVVARATAAKGLDRAVEFLPLMGFGDPNHPESATEQLDEAADHAPTMKPEERTTLADRLDELAQTQRAGSPPMADALAQAASALRAGDSEAARAALGAASKAQTAALAAAAAAERRAGAAAALSAPTDRLAAAAAAGHAAAGSQGPGGTNGGTNGGAPGDGRGGGGGGQLAGQTNGQGGGAVVGAKGGTGSGVSAQGRPADVDGDGNAAIPEFDFTEQNGTLTEQGAPPVTVAVGGGGASGEGDGDVVGHSQRDAEDGSAVVAGSDAAAQYQAQATTAVQRPDIPAAVRDLVRRYFAQLGNG